MDGDAEEIIRLRAYAIWESEGRPEGRQEEHWRRASGEMHGLEDAPASAVRPVHVALAGGRDESGKAGS